MVSYFILVHYRGIFPLFAGVPGADTKQILDRWDTGCGTALQLTKSQSDWKSDRESVDKT